MQRLIGSHISHRTDISSHWLETIIEKDQETAVFSVCFMCAFIFFKDHSCSSHISLPNEPNCAGFGLTFAGSLKWSRRIQHSYGIHRHISPALPQPGKPFYFLLILKYNGVIVEKSKQNNQP